MPNKQYLLQIGESLALAVLLAIYPIFSTGHIDWIALLIVAGFALAHASVAYIKNQALRDAISHDLDALQQAMPWRGAWTATKAVAPPQPIVLPKSDTPPQS